MVIGVIIAIVVVLIVINQKPQSSSTIKIGVVGPFTGNSAVFGEFMQRGIDFALAGLSEEDRARVQIIKEDDQCSEKVAISAIKKLIGLDNVNYVIGPVCNAASLASESLFEENKVISLSVGLPSNKIANMGSYHFSFGPEIQFLMNKVTEEIHKKDFKRIAVIHMNGPFENENYNYFVKFAQEHDITIVADESAAKDTSDFSTLISKIRTSQPEAIMLIAHTAELNNILKQLHIQNLGGLPKFGIHAGESPVLMEYIGLAEGMIYAYPSDELENESAKLFTEKYYATYHEKPHLVVPNAYDSFNVLFEAIQSCGYEYKDCVRDYIANLKNYEGANGVLSLDKRGVGQYRDLMLRIVRDGQFQKLNP